MLGTSFGAYHAVNFGFRHPDAVNKVVGFSGKYDIHSFLDGYWGDLCLLPLPDRLRPEHGPRMGGPPRAMDIAIVTGETDNILQGSQDMIRILHGKGIPHRGHIWNAPYGHDWQWWKEQIHHCRNSSAYVHPPSPSARRSHVAKDLRFAAEAAGA